MLPLCLFTLIDRNILYYFAQEIPVKLPGGSSLFSFVCRLFVIFTSNPYPKLIAGCDWATQFSSHHRILPNSANSRDFRRVMPLTSCYDRHNNDASAAEDDAVFDRQLGRSSPFPWNSAWNPHGPDRPDCTVSPFGNLAWSRARFPIDSASLLASRWRATLRSSSRVSLTFACR